MDFLWGIVMGLLLAIAALALGSLSVLIWPQCPGWLRALRRRLRRWSEPRLRVTLRGTLTEHNAGKHTVYQFATCSSCNPQPTSPPPSAPTTGRGTGPHTQPGARADTIRWLQGEQGNED